MEWRHCCDPSFLFSSRDMPSVLKASHGRKTRPMSCARPGIFHWKSSCSHSGLLCTDLFHGVRVHAASQLLDRGCSLHDAIAPVGWIEDGHDFMLLLRTMLGFTASARSVTHFCSDRQALSALWHFSVPFMKRLLRHPSPLCPS